VADLAAYASETLSANHVFIRDPAKRRVRGLDLREAATGPCVVRESPKGCDCPPTPWLVLAGSGSALRIPFSGRRIHTYFVQHGYCGSAEMWVNGVPVATIGMAADGPAVYGCWRSAVLPPGEHVLEIRTLADRRSGHGEVWLDDVVIER
jgi:hypothetical protein